MDKKYLAVMVFFFALAVGGGIYALSSKSSLPQNSPLPSVTPSATIVPETPSTSTPSAKGVSGKSITMENGLKIEDLTIGTGPDALSGKTITVNYSGTLTNGTKFDSSYDRGTPFTFVLGAGDVIQGWDLGFAGMKVGGKRKLTIPPELGYGSADLGTIPPNSTLIFEVELLKVE